MFVGVSTGGRDNNIGLLADISRVKDGDLAFFYIEGKSTKKGRFFGIFRIAGSDIYHLTGTNAYSPNLPVKLIYRRKIEPYKVYAQGVLEWVALDKLPTYSKELLWTLIYRKMKAGRGNTMLFPWETERLISLIEEENQGKDIKSTKFIFDQSKYEITSGSKISTHNLGNSITIPLSEIINSETHFQAYILQNLALHDNQFYPEIFGNNIVWIGNEVFAGTGMQKIDIVTIENVDETSKLFRLIELKHPKSTTNINFAPTQLEYYINWARDDIGGHIIGGKNYNIKPVVISLTKELNTTSDSITKEIRALDKISASPEIWEMDFSSTTNKIL
jgi:hypothetical protein